MRGFWAGRVVGTLEGGYLAQTTGDFLTRLFSSYPDGMLGVGLLLFRVVIGTVTILFAARWITGSLERTAYVWVIGGVAAVCGVMLVVGFMTLIAGVLASISILAITFATEAFLSPAISVALLNLVTAALNLGLALTGPGAFSIEGHLYGRREIVVPPHETSG